MTSWPQLNQGTSRLAYVDNSLDFPLKQLWHMNLPSTVLASPIFANGRLFASAISGLYAIDAGTGDIVWDFKFDDVPYPQVNAFKAPPVHWEDRLFVSDMKGMVYCVNAADGALRWQADHLRCLSDPLCLYDDKLFTHTSIERNGDRVWGYACWTMDAHELWFFESEGPHRTTSCAIKDGILIFGDATGTLYAIDALSGEELWRLDIRPYVSIIDHPYRKKGIAPQGLPMISGETIIQRTGGNRNITAIHLRTGEIIWHHVVDSDFDFFSEAIALAVDDQAVYYMIRGLFRRINLHSGIVELTTDNNFIGRTNSRALNSLVVGSHYFAGFNMSRRLAAFDARSGHLIWDFIGEGGLTATPIWVDESLYTASDLGEIRCFAQP